MNFHQFFLKSLLLQQFSVDSYNYSLNFFFFYEFFSEFFVTTYNYSLGQSSHLFLFRNLKFAFFKFLLQNGPVLIKFWEPMVITKWVTFYYKMGQLLQNKP